MYCTNVAKVAKLKLTNDCKDTQKYSGYPKLCSGHKCIVFVTCSTVRSSKQKRDFRVDGIYIPLKCSSIHLETVHVGFAQRKILCDLKLVYFGIEPEKQQFFVPGETGLAKKTRKVFCREKERKGEVWRLKVRAGAGAYYRGRPPNL